MKLFRRTPITIIALLLMMSTGCFSVNRQKGGHSVISTASGTKIDTIQNENPKNDTTQNVHSKKTVTYTIPKGSWVPVGDFNFSGQFPTNGSRPISSSGGGQNTSSQSKGQQGTILAQDMPVVVLVEDNITTKIGGSLKDMVGMAAEAFKALHPVLYAALAMMTLIPLIAFKMGWPTIAVKSVVLGLLMLAVYYFLPTYGGAIMGVGLGILVVGSGFLIYGYYRGHGAGLQHLWEKNQPQGNPPPTTPATQ